MSKRFNNYHGRQDNKKPKLDINVYNRSSSGPLPSKRLNLAETKISNSNESFLEDEEDDIILLASQRLEAVEHYSQQITSQGGQNSLTSISFSKFSREVESSTQLDPCPASTSTKNKESENIIGNNIIDWDLEDDLLHCENEILNNNVENRVFKVPNATREQNKITRTNEAKNNNAKEVQIQYLQNRIEELRKENDKLQKNISNSNEKILTKEGEVSVLRQELRQLQQQIAGLHLRKIEESDTMKKEWQSKIDEYEKLLKTHQSELEFKTAEINNLRTKRLNESQRMGDTSFMDQQRCVFKKLPTLMNLELSLNYTKIKMFRSSDDRKKIPKEIFEKSRQQKINFQENLFYHELEYLQSVLAQMDITRVENFKTDFEVEINVAVSAKKFFSEFNKYMYTLNYPKYRDTNAQIEHNFLSNIPVNDKTLCILHHQGNEKTIYQEASLFTGEKSIVARRLLSALAIICRDSPLICERVLMENIEETTVMEVILNNIDLLGYTKELYKHTGVIEAFGSFLCSIISNSSTIYGKYPGILNFIINFFKILIFSRPTYRSLVQISECLLKLTSCEDINIKTINGLCTKNVSGSFYPNEYYKIFLFTTKTCPLQVYGILLEVAFPQYEILSIEEINKLCEILQNHISFLRICYDMKVEWIWKNGNMSENEPACDCYAKLINGFVILFHLLLYQWLHATEVKDIKKIEKIIKMGCPLIYNTFQSNYHKAVLQSGGNVVKQRLQILIDWLNEHKYFLRFKPNHEYVLESLHLSTKIADPVKNAEKSKDEVAFFDAHDIWLSIFDDFI